MIGIYSRPTPARGQYERIMEYLARSKAEGKTSLSDALAREETALGNPELCDRHNVVPPG